MNRSVRLSLIVVLAIPVVAALAVAVSIFFLGMHWGISALEQEMTRLFVLAALGIITTPLLALIIEMTLGLRKPSRDRNGEMLMMKGPRFH